MTRLIVLIALLLCQTALRSQGALPEMLIPAADMEAQLRFLSSDELQGRRTGSAGNNIAARYIASHLQAYQCLPPTGADQYFQTIPFETVKPPSTGSFKVGDMAMAFGKEFVLLGGAAGQVSGEAIFAGYGWVDAEKGFDDYKDLAVKGKVVFVLSGLPDDKDPITVFRSMKDKRQLAADRGAAALVELYQLPFPWQFFVSYFNKEGLQISDGTDSPLPYVWMKAPNDDFIKPIRGNKPPKVTIESSGFMRSAAPSHNVMGIIPGSDPLLREEYVLLTAHYDHVGTGADGGMPFSPEDSIFNGARDNAMGTVALLTAAKALAQQPPKRSVIILAVTGEEIGLLGSGYYADNPLIPLHKVIFNLNTDGAGYNDTQYISIVGAGRTGTDAHIAQGAGAFGLKVFNDPAPDQGLFDRSDNVSFATKGVPAANFSPGMTAFDEAIMQYYHQVADEADSVDFEYFAKYCRAFAHTARLIADGDERPRWKAKDKYEAAGKVLYGLD